MRPHELAARRADELEKEYIEISKSIGLCDWLADKLDPADPDAIAATADRKRLVAKCEALKKEIIELRLQADPPPISYNTH